jgi:hypothetical protein
MCLCSAKLSPLLALSPSRQALNESQEAVKAFLESISGQHAKYLEHRLAIAAQPAAFDGQSAGDVKHGPSAGEPDNRSRSVSQTLQADKRRRRRGKRARED